MRRTCLVFLALTASCGAFDRAETSMDCGGGGHADASSDIHVDITGGVGEQPLGTDLHIKGTASHSRHITIRQLSVQGVSATLDSDNYKTWSAVVPETSLVGDGTDGSKVSLKIEAEDSCGQRLSLDVPVTLVAKVQRLSLTTALPSGAPYLPANGTTSAVLTVTANPEARGALVTLGATTGATFTGATNGSVVLSGPTGADVTATFLVTSSKAGALTVSATARDQVATVTLPVAGPPTFLPSHATLVAGQSLGVTLDTQGSVESCQASPAPGLHVTTGAQDISTQPGAIDSTGDGLVDLVVIADPGLTTPQTVTVVCRDPFGQSASATFTASP